MKQEDELQKLKQEQTALYFKTKAVKESIEKIHAERLAEDEEYCKRCETSPCKNRGAYYDEDED